LPKLPSEEDDASEDVFSAGGGGVAAAALLPPLPPPDELELPPPNPHPDLGATLPTSSPEQIPMERKAAQQASDAQSAPFKH